MKMHRVRTLAILLILALMCGLLAGCGTGTAPSQASAQQTPAAQEAPPSETRVYSINSPQAVALFEQWIGKFIAYSEELSNGSIQFNLYPTGSMGNSTEAISSCQMGSLDFVIGGDVELGPIVENSDWCSLPRYVTSHEQGLNEYINGFIGEYADEQYAQSGLISLGRIDNSFRMLAIKGKSIQTESDVAGLKIRIPNQPLPMSLYKAMDALPVAMAASEVLIALEQNTIDGADNAIFLFDQFKQYDLFDSIVALNYGYGVINMFCSKLTWDSIPAADQEILRQAAQKACDWYHEEFFQAEQEVIDRAKADGKFVEPDEAWQDDMVEVYDQIWEEALSSGKYDEQFIQQLHDLYLNNTGR